MTSRTIVTDIRDQFGHKLCEACIGDGDYTVFNFKNVKQATISLEDLQGQIQEAVRKHRAKIKE